MPGVAGQYFRQFGLTVAVAVLFSLLVARLITPMMAAYLMKPMKHHEAKDGPLMRGYLAFLAFTLKRWRIGRGRVGVPVSNAYITLVVGVAILVASVWATALLPTAFIPDEDNSRIVANVELPPGATLEDTRLATDDIVRRLREHPEVRHVFALGGASATGQREVRRAALFIRLVPKTERKIAQKDFKAVVADRLRESPDIRAWYVNERGEREMAFSIMSRDGQKLEEAVARLEARMRQVDGFLNVAATGALTRPELRVRPRMEQAAELGVSPEAISEAVRVATIGDAGANLAKFNVGDRLVPIRVQLEEDARTDLRRLQALRVTSASGRSIRSAPSRTSASARGQAPSTATTACAAPRSARTSSAGCRSAPRRRSSTRSSRRSACPRASGCS